MQRTFFFEWVNFNPYSPSSDTTKTAQIERMKRKTKRKRMKEIEREMQMLEASQSMIWIIHLFQIFFQLPTVKWNKDESIPKTSFDYVNQTNAVTCFLFVDSTKSQFLNSENKFTCFQIYSTRSFYSPLNVRNQRREKLNFYLAHIQSNFNLTKDLSVRCGSTWFNLDATLCLI